MAATIRKVIYNLLRQLGLTTIFGNPGSPEETFLQDFPADFTYVLGSRPAAGRKAEVPVWTAPSPEQMAFSEEHPLFQGILPFAIGPLSEK